MTEPVFAFGGVPRARSGLRRCGYLTCIAGALVVSIWAVPAQAQSSAQDRALAEALFREAKKLVEKGETSAACGKFTSSYRLDPALGTLLHLATCHQEEGKTASAWIEFTDAADMARRAGDTKRQKLALSRAKSLESLLSRLVVAIDNPPEGLSVKLDGKPIDREMWGTPLPLDPGEREIEASAPGKETWKKTLSIKPGAAEQTVDVPTLEDEAEEAKPAPVAPSPEPSPPSPPPESDTDDGSGQRLAGFVVGGVGLVALGVGTYFGLRAASQHSDADELCNGTLCTQAGLDGQDDARGSALISTIGFGVGLAGIAVGTVLVLTAGGSSEPSTAARQEWVGLAAGPGTLGLQAGGAW